jgi:hypothetical protein
MSQAVRRGGWTQGDTMGELVAIVPKSEIRMSKSETMTEIRISNDPNPLFQVKCFEFGINLAF